MHQEPECHVVGGVGVPGMVGFGLAQPVEGQRLQLVAAAIVGVQEVLLLHLGDAEEDHVSGRRRSERRKGGRPHGAECTAARWQWIHVDRERIG